MLAWSPYLVLVHLQQHRRGALRFLVVRLRVADAATSLAVVVRSRHQQQANVLNREKKDLRVTRLLYRFQYQKVKRNTFLRLSFFLFIHE